MIDAARDIELDTGPRAPERERLCVATRTVRPVSELIRFVVGPEGEPVPDLKRKLPGRGIWVTATNGALGEAIKRKAFSRGFKREIRAAGGPRRPDRTAARARRHRCAGDRRQGRLVAAGFGKTAAALEHEKVAGLLHAAEAAPDGIRKLDALMRRPVLR